MEANLKKVSEYVFELLRGGYIFHKDDVYIQFGTPPETIKDTMLLEQGVPNIFVLPDKFFNFVKGISVAEMEFPIYYNFFLRKSKTKIVCTQEQRKNFEVVFKEAVFGPENLNIFQDYSEYTDDLLIPDIKSETQFFGSHFVLKDMIEFYIFKEIQCKLENNVTIVKGKEFFTIYQDANKVADVPINITSKPNYDIGLVSETPFNPPSFGITCLGSSHGFDPTQNTSGFILWLNGSGIMIDPPVNSTDWLLDSNVNPKFIDSIILTHCHADHDSGTLQKILEERKISVYTTKTVMDSFLRKYSAFTGVEKNYLKQLFNFNRVFIGRAIYIHGGQFSFFYSLHSIPTVGFRLIFQNKTFVYSSDHNNDPKLHQELLKKNIISKARYNELSSFPWHFDIIYHEAGIPPLHTPISALNELPVEVQKKITTYHISQKDFSVPGTVHLELAKFGIKETKYLDLISDVNDEACNIIKIFKNLDFLGELSIEKALEFIQIVKKKSYFKGTTIIKKGDLGDKFYVIQKGKVSVIAEGLKVKKIYSEYDYFGEVSVISNSTATADVMSETDVVLYYIQREPFLSFITGTEFEVVLNKLIKTRQAETWNLLSTSKFLYFLTSTQKTFLEVYFIQVQLPPEHVLLSQDDKVMDFYIIQSGEVHVMKDNIKITVLKRGDFIGELYEIVNHSRSKYTFVSSGNVKLYKIDFENITEFVKRNPGLIMKIRYEI